MTDEDRTSYRRFTRLGPTGWRIGNESCLQLHGMLAVAWHRLRLSLLSGTGEPGAGKSQLALQAIVAAQRTSCNGGPPNRVVWIYTEGLPPTQRLQQLVHGCNERSGPGSASMDNVLLQHMVQTPDDMLRTVQAACAIVARAQQSSQPVSRTTRPSGRSYIYPRFHER